MAENNNWNICSVSFSEYKKVTKSIKVFFNQADFNELNRGKVDIVHYLIIYKGSSARFALILGQVGDVAHCPFSAPYSYPVAIKGDARIEDYDSALHTVIAFCTENRIHEIRFTFPPLYYDEHILSAWISSFFRNGFIINQIDVNYTIDLCRFNNDNYISLIPPKGRGHLRKAIKNNIQIDYCELEDMQFDAYKIIVANHTSKGRPTYMSFEDLENTFKLVEHDVFLARINEQRIASMINYHVTDDIVQCIYACHLPEYSNIGVMNFMLWYAIQFYGNQGIKLFDWGTATEDSIPNVGLCDFKESVGASRGLKYSFVKKL